VITVAIAYNRDTREASLRLLGHAGYAEAGQDIVCASASILAYTVAQIVKAMEHHGDFAEPPFIRLDGGDTAIVCQAKDDDLYAEVVHTYFVAQTGYALLAHNYPQHVELITDDRGL
jgi:uncharacterized protein YsxB (DUF464 family)